MNISRRFALIIHFILDECVPPILRDQKWFIWLPFRLLFGDKDRFFYEFKDQAPDMNAEEFSRVYRETADVHIQRETDLGEECIQKIEQNVVGPSVLEAGCGRGYLANILSRSHKVTACDIAISEAMTERYEAVRFQRENVESLSFTDQIFDTVVCTHTLEHVQNLPAAVAELRRVAARRLIIVVPKQRPYRYTFDLHLHFFPYRNMLLAFLCPSEQGVNYQLREIQGDWYYQEERTIGEGMQ